MSNAPPPMYAPPAYGYPQPTRTSAAAVTSLVCGIVGCFVITPLIAIVTGIVGIRATGNPAVRGRGMAVAGLILGLVWMLGFVAITAGGLVVWRNSEPPAAVARQFTTDLANGNVAALKASSFGVSDDELAKLVETAKPWGPVSDVTLPSRKATKNVGSSTKWELAGTATFTVAGTKDVSYLIESKPDGGYRVLSVEFK